MKVSIIGSGVVGKATGQGLRKRGIQSIFCDIDRMKLEGLEAEGCETTQNVEEAVKASEISFICVQTPTFKERIDLSYIRKATEQVGKALRERDDYHLVAVRSTVLPTTTRKKIIPILERYSGLKPSEDFGVCYNPEFMREATALEDFLNPWRIVIGQLDQRSGDLLERLYSTFNAPKIRTGLEEAEMIKCASNTFLATKISLFNEIHAICEKLKLDPNLIAEATALDPRIGKYGIYGGRPFRGRCLPKDLEAFVSFVKDMRLNPKILDSVLSINRRLCREEETGNRKSP